MKRDVELIASYAGCTRDGVRIFGVNGERFPEKSAGGGIEGDEAAVERANEDFSLPDGDASIDHVTARVGSHSGTLGS